MKQHKLDDVVVPINLQKGGFIVVALDNIDEDNSTLDNIHLHGTSLSIFQFVSESKLNVANANYIVSDLYIIYNFKSHYLRDLYNWVNT